MKRNEALEMLRKLLNPGDTVWCNLKHVSRSGMMRAIDLRTFYQGERGIESNWLSGLVGAAGILRYSKQHEAIRMNGCGMDMGFAAVYELSHALFPDGFGCIGEGCPSNDHSNGDRDFTPHADHTGGDPEQVCAKHQAHKHWHKDGGYALRHRWL